MSAVDSDIPVVSIYSKWKRWPCLQAMNTNVSISIFQSNPPVAALRLHILPKRHCKKIVCFVKRASSQKWSRFGLDWNVNFTLFGSRRKHLEANPG